MSNRRTIVYLLFLLTLVVGANLWLDIVGARRGEVVRRKSLASAADGAVAIEISSSRSDHKVRLEKTDIWRIVEPFRAAADQTSVAKLTDALAFAPIADSIDEASALKLGRTKEDFGLADPSLSLKVFSAGGALTVDFGADFSAGREVYAAVGGVPAVFVVPSGVRDAADLAADSWRRRTVFTATADEIVSIDIRHGDSAPMRLTRNGERWEVAEPRQALASAALVKRIVDTVLSCKARKFVWPVGASNETVTASVSLLAGYGLDPETCDTVSFRTTDGRTHSISLGSAADADSVYALIQGGTAVATVAAEAKSTLSVDVGTLVDGRLFPLEKSAVQRISIVDGDTAYQLALDGNGLWRIDAPVAAAADQAVVDGLIDKLLLLRSSDLDENGVKISLFTSAVPVAVSRSALLGDGGFEELRSKVVVDIDAATVKRLVVSRSGSTLPESVVFDPDRKGWNVESTGRTGVIDQDRLNAVLAALDPLKAKSVVRLKVPPEDLAKYGLETPSCTIAVDRLLENSVRRNILLGNAVDGGGDVYATVGTSDAVFVIDSAAVKVLVSGVLSE